MACMAAKAARSGPEMGVTAMEGYYSSAGPRSGLGCSVAVRHPLIDPPCVPLVGTPRFRRMAAYWRCLRCAGAPKRPASGSALSLHIPSRHAVLSDLGESIIVLTPMSTLAFAMDQRARHSQ